MKILRRLWRFLMTVLQMRKHNQFISIAKWMAEIDASYFIIRPDFYVAATAKTAEYLALRFDQVMEKLHLNT